MTKKDTNKANLSISIPYTYPAHIVTWPQSVKRIYIHKGMYTYRYIYIPMVTISHFNLHLHLPSSLGANTFLLVLELLKERSLSPFLGEDCFLSIRGDLALAPDRLRRWWLRLPSPLPLPYLWVWLWLDRLLIWDVSKEMLRTVSWVVWASNYDIARRRKRRKWHVRSCYVVIVMLFFFKYILYEWMDQDTIQLVTAQQLRLEMTFSTFLFNVPVGFCGAIQVYL